MADVTVLIRVVDDQVVPVPIDDVLVRVFDDSDVFVTEGLTGDITPGEIEFTLPGFAGGTSYTLRYYKTGVSFLPQPQRNIAITDVDPPVTIISGHIGETGAVAVLVAQTTDVAPVPIESVLFKLYSAAGAYLTEALSNAQGKVEIAVEATQYIIRMFKSGWVFSNGPTQTIEVLNPPPVGSTNTFDFPAAQPIAPQSNDPNLCLLSGYFVDAAMRPLKNLRLRFMLILTDPDLKMSGFPGAGNPAVVIRKQVFSEAVFETNDDGYLEVLLPRASCYDVHIHGCESPGVPQYAQIYVPDAAWAYIEDVLFPYSASVMFDPTTLSLVVGGIGTVTPTIMGSNLQELDNQYNQMFMDFTTADATIATVTVGANGTLVVTGLAAGSNTLTANRSLIKSTYVPRLPDVPALFVTPVTITVS